MPRSGENLIIGTARFVDAKTIEVTNAEGNTRLLTAERLFINIGTQPLIPLVPGLQEAGFLTSESIMELDQLPEHLIIMGSGYIGLKFAQMFRRFGSRVTVIEQSEQILSQQDPDIAIAVQTLLERGGIEFLLMNVANNRSHFNDSHKPTNSHKVQSYEKTRRKGRSCHGW